MVYNMAEGAKPAWGHVGPSDAPEGIIKTCRVPRCLAQRRRQGQDNGRFLLEYWQDAVSVYVTVVCPDCGTQHTIEILKR